MGLEKASEDAINKVHNHHDDHHSHGEHHKHAHDDFDSFVVSLGEVDDNKLINALGLLIEELSIYRAKGFAAIPGKPMRKVIQGVGTRIDQYFDRLWQADETRSTNIVIIGKDLDEEYVTSKLAEAVI